MSPQPIKIAILAMGGEGGGVLADWIIDLAEHNGHVAQGTSVPGVAQRTGATIYYVELFPTAAVPGASEPVLALMPLPGDVDIVLASELMEAGRAVQRGLVTPDRTTLIASTHRVWSIAEKTALGDGRVDGESLLAHTEAAARRLVRFDMAEVAEQSGSVISAVLFGALAGTGALPFSRTAFEETIARGGVGVAASRRAFDAGFARAQQGDAAGKAARAHADAALKRASAVASSGQPSEQTDAAERIDPAVRELLRRAESFPGEARAIVLEGIRRTIDWQDPAHAALYLDRLDALQRSLAAPAPRLVAETARHLALWMTYEDTVRVAALKTRASRFERVHGEVRARDDQLLAIDEYMHPRVQEICETLPRRLGSWLERSGWPRRLLERFTQQGRVVTTSSLPGFLLLYSIAGLRRFRRASGRFAVETQRIEAWLADIARVAAGNPALAVEVAQCQRLVKGYGDTHARGWRNFGTLMAVVEKQGDALAPATLRELRDAALADERGDTLHAALTRHALA
ncbi:MAG TPA: indolepyruvate oxidoreductase subunit beta family protein [Caldimonas sp.]|jgi:indolepyruvate ferredoxin oxidoreductase beta subunit|nr:indolepyruvate oxidoreductase subunit beta family protein [Caldimonas sp.]HEX2542223.1 indolepyruvate oxidoreductase subunit beta family protein [Caldimonas sp.]